MMSIDLTPKAQGYRAIAERFRSQILADVKRPRYASDVEILRALIELAGYLAVNAPDEYKRLLNPLGE